ALAPLRRGGVDLAARLRPRFPPPRPAAPVVGLRPRRPRLAARRESRKRRPCAPAGGVATAGRETPGAGHPGRPAAAPPARFGPAPRASLRRLPAAACVAAGSLYRAAAPPARRRLGSRRPLRPRPTAGLAEARREPRASRRRHG